MYVRLAVTRSRRSTPGSSANSLIIVLSQNPHNSASSFTRKCFTKASVIYRFQNELHT